MLAHPNPGATLAIFSDASDQAVGTALKQFVDGAWQPLDFFSKKLSPAESKYGAYDRELLAIYLAVIWWSSIHNLHEPRPHHLCLQEEEPTVLISTIPVFGFHKPVYH